MMHEVTIIGTAWDVDSKYSQSGVAISKFNVSQYDGKDKKTDKAKYFNTEVICFKELAELAGNELKRGDSVIIVGRRSQESWEDKETGKKRYKDIVIAESIAKNIKQYAKKDKPATSGEFTAGDFGEEVPF